MIIIINGEKMTKQNRFREYLHRLADANRSPTYGAIDFELAMRMALSKEWMECHTDPEIRRYNSRTDFSRNFPEYKDEIFQAILSARPGNNTSVNNLLEKFGKRTLTEETYGALFALLRERETFVVSTEEALDSLFGRLK